MNLPIAYCDFNATTPLREKVKETMIEAMDIFGNPSSSHSTGRQARGYLEKTRDILAQTIKVEPEDVVFTSCGSESNNTILKHHQKTGAKIFVSAIEHACILNSLPEADRLSVLENGEVDTNYLKNKLEKTRKSFNGPIVVVVMYANNETGIIQPIKEIVEISKYYNALVHCDAVQVLGKVNIDFNNLGVDSLSFSAHKIGGPKGVGAYVAKPQLKVEPLIHGGGQERGNRSGTENVIGIAGFGTAITESLSDDWSKIELLRNMFEDESKKIIPGFFIHGKKSNRMKNTSCFAMPGFINKMQVISFDLDRICVGAGSACSSGKSKPSHVLSAMGVDEDLAYHSVRVSLGWSSTEEEVKRLIKSCKDIYSRSQNKRIVA